MNRATISFRIQSVFFATSVAIASSTIHAFAAPNNNEDYNLLLAGGALKTCSSMASRNCVENTFSETAKSANLYKISSEAIESFKNSDVFESQTDAQKQQFHAIFKHFYASFIGKTTRGLSDVFAETDVSFDAESFYLNLPDPVYYGLQDFFEIQHPDKEQVDLNNNRFEQVTKIYTTFLQQAAIKHKNEGKPDNLAVNIGILTSSGRDSLSSADFYVSVFEEAAKFLPNYNFNVSWVPLDVSVATAIAGQNSDHSCENLENIRASNLSFNRAAVYPELVRQQQMVCQNPDSLLTQLNSLSGLFINGGDQNRTRQTLFKADGTETPWLASIRNRLEKHHLILGGTSAGTAVQSGGLYDKRPVPMITSGNTMTALFRGAFALAPPPYGCEKTNTCPHGLLESDLTYNPAGGINTFNTGILDTHFSERDRQGRLALLAAATKTRFGFGVDEATAMLVDTRSTDYTNIKVIGVGGVFLVNMHDGIYKSQAQKHQIVGMSHFLTDGDRAKLNNTNGEIDFYFAEKKRQLESKTSASQIHKGTWRKQINAICGQTTFHRWSEDDIAYLVNPSEETRFYLDMDDPMAHCSYVNLLFGIEN